jgi:hypothetical protein
LRRRPAARVVGLSRPDVIPAFDAWAKGRSGRWGKPAELIGAAVFLASQAGDCVNGGSSMSTAA